jgi:hypothetical protein
MGELRAGRGQAHELPAEAAFGYGDEEDTDSAVPPVSCTNREHTCTVVVTSQEGVGPTGHWRSVASRGVDVARGGLARSWAAWREWAAQRGYFQGRGEEDLA